MWDHLREDRWFVSFFVTVFDFPVFSLFSGILDYLGLICGEVSLQFVKRIVFCSEFLKGRKQRPD